MEMRRPDAIVEEILEKYICEPDGDIYYPSRMNEQREIVYLEDELVSLCEENTDIDGYDFMNVGNFVVGDYKASFNIFRIDSFNYDFSFSKIYKINFEGYIKKD